MQKCRYFVSSRYLVGPVGVAFWLWAKDDVEQDTDRERGRKSTGREKITASHWCKGFFDLCSAVATAIFRA